MEDYALVIENLTVKRKKFSLKEISFSLPQGYIMGISGKNGAGKSTLLSCLFHLDRKDSGNVYILGKDLRENREACLKEIGFISESNTFVEERSMDENANLYGVFYDNWDPQLFQKLCQELKLPRGRSVGKLSRGERSKFQMAFAMAHHSKLYVIDEATVGMDPIFVKEFYQYLKSVMDTDMASALIVTHNPSEIKKNMDYLGIMEEGKMVSVNQVDESVFMTERTFEWNS